MSIWVDVSDYQGAINFAAVKAAGVDGVVVKASEGTTGVQAHLQPSADGAIEAGLRVGLYHFGRPDLGLDPYAEAQHFLQQAGPWLNRVAFLALDLEVGSGALAGWALRFLAAVQQGGARQQPWLYTYISFIGAHLADARLSSFPLWLADYQATPPPCPWPWPRYTMWQETSQGRVAGITGAVDVDVPFFTTASPQQHPQHPFKDYQTMSLATTPNGVVEAIVGQQAPDGGYHAWIHEAPTAAALPQAPWTDLGGNCKEVSVVAQADGTLLVSVRGADDHQWYRWQTPAQPGQPEAWSPWQQGSGIDGTFGQ